MANIRKGDKVRQIVNPIEGEVTDFAIDRENGDRLMLVEWKCEEGHTHSKYFSEEQVEKLPADATIVPEPHGAEGGE